MNVMKVSQKISNEDGQGLVEYALVLFLIVIIVTFLVMSLRGCGDEPPPPATPTVGEPAIDIIEADTNVEIIDSETIPLFNCNNPNEYQVDVERTRTIEHKVITEGQMEAGLQQFVVLSLNGRYGFEDGQKEDRSYTVHLTAAPNSWFEYAITWRYVWREGQLVIIASDGSEESVPYRVRAGLEFSITGIEEKICP